jgi:3-oxoacyl-[acyl-carrier protein] reductase
VVVNYAVDEVVASPSVSVVEAVGALAVAIQANVAVESRVNRLFGETLSRFGNLDNLGQRAGTAINKMLARATEEEFDRIFSVDVREMFFPCREAARRMADAGAPSRCTRSAAKM